MSSACASVVIHSRRPWRCWRENSKRTSNTKTVEVNVAVTAAGDVVINKRPVSGSGQPAIVAALQAAVPADAKDPVVIINADAKAAHQRVIDVMQAAQQAGLVHISFATQAAQQ